ncbi:hypothetical protein L1887_30140 [Cichorium endivia]|nr:hypothetical protein L1887_30140 [Cichorium endivia]
MSIVKFNEIKHDGFFGGDEEYKELGCYYIDIPLNADLKRQKDVPYLALDVHVDHYPVQATEIDELLSFDLIGCFTGFLPDEKKQPSGKTHLESSSFTLIPASVAKDARRSQKKLNSIQMFKEDKELEVKEGYFYGTLAYVNCTTGSLYEDGDCKPDVGCSQNDDSIVSVSEPFVVQNPKHGILPWKKRKLNLRSPKTKGEPLLKKAYAEEDGDDIDFDRHQLSSDKRCNVNEEGMNRCVSEFGDDSFGKLIRVEEKHPKVSVKN